MSNSIIIPGTGDTSGVMTPLVPFNCIFDINFALLSLIIKQYFDSSVFSAEFLLSHKQIRKLIKALIEREEENPLKLCILSKYKEEADSLYKEFLEKKYNEIIDLSMPTDVYNLLEIFKLSGDIKSTIVYETEAELNRLDQFEVTKHIPKLRIDEINDMRYYQQFYFNSIYDNYCTLLSPEIKVKVAYIANYKFNVDEKGIKDSKGSLILDMNRNKFMLYSPYDKSKLEGEK